MEGLCVLMTMLWSNREPILPDNSFRHKESDAINMSDGVLGE
jgi:hypothetical protein